MSITQDIQSLAPGSLIELFELDATALGGTITRFHAGTNGLLSSVVWQGNTYQPFPIEASGFEFNGQGQMPRPTLRIANVTGLLGAMVREYSDLLGAKVTRKRTLAKYLDAANFPARRNLYAQTNSISQSGWTKINATTGAALSLSHTGEAAEAVIDTTATAGPYFARSVTVTAGQVYTVSGYFKSRGASPKRYASLWLPNTTVWVGQRNAIFDLDAGSITFTTANCTAAISPAGNGWFRCSMTATPDVSGSTFPQHRLTNSATSGAANYTGTGAAGYDVFGLQFEAGALTDYQPITGSSWSQNPTADPNEHLADDIYYIDRKATENRLLIEFELAASFDVAGVKIPRRIVTQNACPWRYRVMSDASACSYTGTAYFDANDQPVATSDLDVCGKRLTSCEARFGATALPFGGFPACGLTR